MFRRMRVSKKVRKKSGKLPLKEFIFNIAVGARKKVAD